MNFLILGPKSFLSLSVTRSGVFLAASRHLPLFNIKGLHLFNLGNLLARLKTTRNMSKDRQGGSFVSDRDKQKGKNIKQEHQTSSPENSCSSQSSPLKHVSASESTPSKKDNSVLDVKETFLALSLADKRKLYACQDEFVELSKVERWPDLYMKMKTKEKMKISSTTIKYPVDEEMNTKISLWCGDITRLEIDAIVNAANRSLMGGGGVDGAIHRAAGHYLVAECRTLSGCNVGDAKTTCGYKLPAKYVIHTVGPQDRSKTKLTNCYKNCFEEFHKNQLKSIAFCCISTGIYGYPNEDAVHVALDEARKFLIRVKEEGQLTSINRIIFCLFLDIDIKLYKEQMQNYFPVVVPTDEEPKESGEKLQEQQMKKNKNFSNSSEDEKSTTGCDVVLVLDDDIDDRAVMTKISEVEDDGRVDRKDATTTEVSKACMFEDMSQVEENYITDEEMLSFSQVESQMDVCENETQELDVDDDEKVSIQKEG